LGKIPGKIWVILPEKTGENVKKSEKAVKQDPDWSI